LNNIGEDKEKGPENFSDSRRGFLKLAMVVLAFLNGLIVGIPSLRSVIRSSPPPKTGWSEVGDVTALTENTPVKMNFVTQSEDAYLRGTAVRSVWVIKGPQGAFTVFSPVCTHLGCYFTWNDQSGHFECPCHGSVFSMAGQVLGGPAPRPLDALPTKVENGRLSVQWEEFRSGTPEKIMV